MNKDSALVFEAYEQNRIVGNYVMQDDQVIGEFLGDSYSSKLTLHGKQMFMPRAPYAQTVNQGTHMGLWYRNKRNKLIVKDASKWKQFLSDIVSTGDDKYWDGKQMHQHDRLGKKIAATNAYWTKKIAAGADQRAEDAEETKQPYNAMTHLTQAANHIRHILQTNADDEAQVEHIIRMAQIILGPKSDHTDAEYRKMLDGLIVILNRFIIVPMN